MEIYFRVIEFHWGGASKIVGGKRIWNEETKLCISFTEIKEQKLDWENFPEIFQDEQKIEMSFPKSLSYA